MSANPWNLNRSLAILEQYACYDQQVSSSPNQTPRTVMQFWDKEPPEDIQRLLRRTQEIATEFGYEWAFFDENSARDFIAEKSGKELTDVYDLCIHPAMKSDFFRLVYLFHNGGTYLDADMVLHSKLDSLFESRQAIFVQRTGEDKQNLANWFIVTPPKEEIFKKLMDGVANNIQTASKEQTPDEFLSNILTHTGPGALTHLVAQYLEELFSSSRVEDARVQLLPFNKAYGFVANGPSFLGNPLSYKQDGRHWEQANFERKKRRLEEQGAAECSMDELIELSRLCLSRDESEGALDYAHSAVELAPSNCRASLNLAECLTQLGETDQASATCSALVGKSECSAQALRLLIRLERKKGNGPAALEYCEELLQNKEHHPGDLILAGDLATGLEQLDQAESHYRAAIALDGGIAIAHRKLASILIKKKELDQALKSAKKAVELKPDSHEFHSYLGNLLLNSDPVAAHAAFSASLRINPNHAFSHYGLSRASLASCNAEEAATTIQQAITLHPDNPAFHFHLALVERARGKLQEAEAALLQALELKPDYAVAHRLLSGVWRDSGRLQAALVAAKRALEISPDNADFREHVNKITQLIEKASKPAKRSNNSPQRKTRDLILAGDLATELEQLDQAESHFRAAIALDGGIAIAHRKLASILIKKQEFDQALESAKKAVELKPDSHEFHSYLGSLLLNSDPVAAHAAFSASLRINPNHAFSHYGLSRASLASCNAEEAATNIQQAITLHPDNPAFHFHLALVERARGKLQEAEAALLQALKLKPDYAVAHRLLSGVWRDSGKLQAALEAANRALEISPNNAEFSEHVNNLTQLIQQASRPTHRPDSTLWEKMGQAMAKLPIRRS